MSDLRADVLVGWVAAPGGRGARERWLSTPERARGAGVPQDSRDHLLASAALVRRLSSQVLGAPPLALEVDRTCARCGAPHGRPRIVGESLDVSVSHAGGWVVAAVGRGCRVGVDAEPVRREGVGGPSGLARWTATEAVLKCDGQGVRTGAADVGLAGWRGSPRLTTYPARPAWSRRLRLLALRGGPPGIVGTMAIDTDAPAALVRVVSSRVRW